jgi:hypothetical protein
MMITTDSGAKFELKENADIATLETWSFAETVYALDYLIQKGYTVVVSNDKTTWPTHFRNRSHFLIFLNTPKDGSSVLTTDTVEPVKEPAQDPLKDIPTVKKEAEKPAPKKTRGRGKAKPAGDETST